jgi:hypothetical protein
MLAKGCCSQLLPFKAPLVAVHKVAML